MKHLAFVIIIANKCVFVTLFPSFFLSLRPKTLSDKEIRALLDESDDDNIPDGSDDERLVDDDDDDLDDPDFEEGLHDDNGSDNNEEDDSDSLADDVSDELSQP